MSALRKPAKLTVEEYLRIENAAFERSEFYDGEMFAMAGATGPHNLIKDNLVLELGNRLCGSGCRTASSDQRVRTPNGLYTYPDVVVFCGRQAFDPLDAITMTNPRAVVEVLSPSTAGYDRGPKLRQYQRVPGLVEVVLVAHDMMAVEVFTRQPDGRWVFAAFDDPAGEVELPGLGVRISLADVYRDALPPTPTRLDPPGPSEV